jgi:hypothetical protein
MNLESRMADESHRLLLGHSLAGESRDNRHSRAVKGKMGEADSPEKAVPIACSLCWHLVGHLPALFLHFSKKRPQSRDKRSGVATSAFDRERDFARFDIDVFERKACLAKAAALANRDFKGDAHPLRLRFKFFPYQSLFLRRYLMLVFGKVCANPELRAGISRREFSRDCFKHDDAPDTDVEERAIKANRAEARVLGRILTPFQVINDMLSFDLAWPPEIVGFQKRGYGTPRLLVFGKRVSVSVVARFEKRYNPSIKVFLVGNTSGIGLLLTSFRSELARLGGFRTNANTTAGRLVADLSSGISKLYPPIRGAIALIDGGHRLVSLSVTSVTNSVNFYLGISVSNQVWLPSTLYSWFESKRGSHAIGWHPHASRAPQSYLPARRRTRDRKRERR